MAIGFMSFGGMLTGGDEPEVKEDKTVKAEVEEDKEKDKITVADNIKAIE